MLGIYSPKSQMRIKPSSFENKVKSEEAITIFEVKAEYLYVRI